MRIPSLILTSTFLGENMKTDYEFLKTDIDGHILTVTINRPERMNALHPPAHAEFDEVWNEFDKDENLWVGIVLSLIHI